MSEQDFLSLRRAGLLKLHGGMERVFNAFTCSGKSKFAAISFSSSFTPLQCKKNMQLHTHIYVFNSTGSSLYCSLLTFRLMNRRGGKTAGGPREACPAQPHAQMPTSGNPCAGQGCRGLGTCPALGRVSSPSPEGSGRWQAAAPAAGPWQPQQQARGRPSRRTAAALGH